MKQLNYSRVHILVALFTMCLFWQQTNAQQYSIVITGDFESKCILPNEGQYYIDELPHVMVACQGLDVNYTAFFSADGDDAVSWSWTVNGATSYSTSNNVAHVIWGNGENGELAVTVTTASGRVFTHYQYVRLIENPVAVAATVPTCTQDHLIYVCQGENVEFTDQSYAVGSDIVGYYWKSPYGEASTHSYTIENIVSDCEVIHRVYNNCGCYDEEVFAIIVLDGEPLRIDCYGTACEGSSVSYHATSPACNDYLWAIEGGTLISGQHTPDITVIWDNPQNGYGIISLDGTVCGGNACSNKMSIKVPIIQRDVPINGATSVCEGEAVIYSAPLYGSTSYEWTITPSIGYNLINNANQIEYIFSSPGTYHLFVKYKCDFLACGEFYSDTLTIEVKPRLTIAGDNEICITNPCSLSTTPNVTANWQIRNLANNQLVYSSTSPESQISTTFNSPGQYRVTAQNVGYCSEAEFFLTVKAAPPAPTLGDINSDNPTVACPNSAISLKSNPGNPMYSIIWEPSCSSATPTSVSGNDVTIAYASEVCDVYAYTYDRQLQCRSTGHYTQTVSPFALAPVSITSPITVCPGSRIKWTNANVPYQEDVIYEWKIEQEKQYCASIQGSIFENEVSLLISDFNTALTSPVSFEVYLYRTYCSGIKDTTTIQIIIDDLSNANLQIVPDDPICQYQEAIFNGSGCTTYNWNFSGDPTTYHGTNIGHTFNEAGLASITLSCNPYSYCNNNDYIPHVSITTMAYPAPPVVSLGYDGTYVYTVPSLNNTDYSFQWGHTSTNNSSVLAIPGVYTYSCIVTSNNYPNCPIELKRDVKPCDILKVVQVGDIDYCTGTISFKVIDPPCPIVWNLDGFSHGAPVYGGIFNEFITIPVREVGNLSITATAEEEPCRSGSLAFTVDFIPYFSFEKQCDKIIIHNNSKYLDGSKIATLYVNNTILTSFTVNQSTIIYPTNGGEDFSFTLEWYNGIHISCPLETVHIANTAGQIVSISSANTILPDQTCDNTAIELTATLPYPHTIMHSHWDFDDHNSCVDTIGNSVSHTFEHRQGDNPSSFYFVSITVTDENGCSSIGSFPIYSNPNVLKKESLHIQNGSIIVCPGSSRIIEYSANGIPPTPPVTFFWLNDGNTSYNYDNYHSVINTDDYSVIVTNDNYCETRATVNVPFLNKPIAIIIPQKYYYCSGETIELFGEPDNSGNYQYLWTITNLETNEISTYTTGNISFTAPYCTSQCDFLIQLTVTDANSLCSATADPVTISVLPTPDAPTIRISDDKYCIADPPVALVCDGPVWEIHWSNGSYGDIAYYYYPGYATAYYYDMTSGCRSNLAEINIPAAPDFDALLTGCYEICPKLLDEKLPVYGLLPVGQQFNWFWYFDGGNNHDEEYNSTTPIHLPLHGYDEYYLDINYFSDCFANSKPLILREDTICNCDGISITYDGKYYIENCELHYDMTVRVCNNSDINVCFSTLNPLFDNGNGIYLSYTDFSTLNLSPNDCDDFHIHLIVSELVPAAAFQLIDENCAKCDKIFGIDLKPLLDDLNVDCLQEVSIVELFQNNSLTDVSTMYYDFHFDFSSLFNNPRVIAVWSEPSSIVDYTFDGSHLFGLGALNLDNPKPTETICIYALICDEDKICIWYYCIPFDEIIPKARFDKPARNGASDKNGNISIDSTGPQLMPNPTTGEVNVIGTNDEVVEVLVMDMNGRKMATFDNTSNFNISTLSSGIYIVRVKTHHDNTDKVTYLKLVKK